MLVFVFFCESETEDLDNLFFLCNLIQRFWLDFQQWACSKGIHIANLSVTDIKYVFSETMSLTLTLIKHYIHKCPFLR